MLLDCIAAVVRNDWQSKPIGAVVVVIPLAKGACEILPRRRGRRGGASVVRRDAAMSRMEDLNDQTPEKAICCNVSINCGCCKAVATERWRTQDEGSPRWLEAIARNRHATIADGCNDCGDDEGHRLAAALGARLSSRGGAQTPQAEAGLQEDCRQSGLSDHARR
jgi:hypothetical protein